MFIVKVAKGHEMRDIDRYTMEELELPGIILMENAAMAVVSETISQVRECNRVVICCGVGNNGGDGFAIARILHCNNIQVTVAIIGDYHKLKGDAYTNFQVVKNLGIPMVGCHTKEQLVDLAQLLKHSDLIYDAIFGTGLDRDITGIYKQVINYINQTNAYTISIDTPSGIHVDTGQILGCAVRANRTVTFCLPKVGLLLHPGTDYVGELVVADIGIPDQSIQQVNPSVMFMDEHMHKALLPNRKQQSHKGTYGKTLIIAGTSNMAGAAVMTTLAAYRAGTGLVKVFIEEKVSHTIPACVPEAIVETYSHVDDTLSEIDREKLIENLEWADAVAIGPGLGNDRITRALLECVLIHYRKTLVIDADGLGSLALDTTILNASSCEIIITPHLGEMARLTKCSIDEISKGVIDIAKDFSHQYQLTCVLKSARTVVASPREDTCINIYGNAGMATAGSGDVLTGIIVSLIAQGLSPYDGALLGVYLHSKAGDQAKKDLGEYGLMATDIIRHLPEVMK